MRLSTRDAIHYAVGRLTDKVRTSGAVSFRIEDVRPGMYKLCIFSYAMCIAELHLQEGVPRPESIVVYSKKRSITTSKHQTWTFGAINMYWGDVLIIEGADPAANAVAHDKAMDHGWGGIDAATLERVYNYREREKARTK